MTFDSLFLLPRLPFLWDTQLILRLYLPSTQTEQLTIMKYCLKNICSYYLISILVFTFCWLSFLERW